MRDFLRCISLDEPRRVAKKMDSTLRGNVGPELHALLEAFPNALAVVCPAYPENGRTVRDGRVFVDGVPVDRSDFARDVISPVRDARVGALLRDEWIALPLATVRAGPAAIVEALRAARARGLRAAVADAETSEDLLNLAATDSLVNDVLWVGSAGLLGSLEAARGPHATTGADVPLANGPVVFLIGSLCAMAQVQVSDFLRNVSSHGERFDPVDLLRGGSREMLRPCVDALTSGRDVLLALDARPERVEAALAFGAACGWDAVAVSRAVREALITFAAPLLANRPGATVVLSGGDVARTFCEAYAVRGLRLLAEAAPGIPISRALGADLYLITKAGGFGRPQTYRDLSATLHSQVTA
jgi:uncharacterized protein YgbK (DUF1537 family)